MGSTYYYIDNLGTTYETTYATYTTYTTTGDFGNIVDPLVFSTTQIPYYTNFYLDPYNGIITSSPTALYCHHDTTSQIITTEDNDYSTTLLYTTFYSQTNTDIVQYRSITYFGMFTGIYPNFNGYQSDLFTVSSYSFVQTLEYSATGEFVGEVASDTYSETYISSYTEYDRPTSGTYIAHTIQSTIYGEDIGYNYFALLPNVSEVLNGNITGKQTLFESNDFSGNFYKRTYSTSQYDITSTSTTNANTLTFYVVTGPVQGIIQSSESFFDAGSYYAGEMPTFIQAYGDATYSTTYIKKPAYQFFDSSNTKYASLVGFPDSRLFDANWGQIEDLPAVTLNGIVGAAPEPYYNSHAFSYNNSSGIQYSINQNFPNRLDYDTYYYYLTTLHNYYSYITSSMQMKYSVATTESDTINSGFDGGPYGNVLAFNNTHLSLSFNGYLGATYYYDISGSSGTSKTILYNGASSMPYDQNRSAVYLYYGGPNFYLAVSNDPKWIINTASVPIYY